VVDDDGRFGSGGGRDSKKAAAEPGGAGDKFGAAGGECDGCCCGRDCEELGWGFGS